ncbi:hypothetical protein BDZ89DRAFT_77221 [Hymenopellis radicata]|nr:hypothetical protein BDZ89DRAFT_77221 [Hymenopellis radicata]
MAATSKAERRYLLCVHHDGEQPEPPTLCTVKEERILKLLPRKSVGKVRGQERGDREVGHVHAPGRSCRLEVFVEHDLSSASLTLTATNTITTMTQQHPGGPSRGDSFHPDKHREALRLALGSILSPVRIPLHARVG